MEGGIYCRNISPYKSNHVPYNNSVYNLLIPIVLCYLKCEKFSTNVLSVRGIYNLNQIIYLPNYNYKEYKYSLVLILQV